MNIFQKIADRINILLLDVEQNIDYSNDIGIPSRYTDSDINKLRTVSCQLEKYKSKKLKSCQVSTVAETLRLLDTTYTEVKICSQCKCHYCYNENCNKCSVCERNLPVVACDGKVSLHKIPNNKYQNCRYIITKKDVAKHSLCFLIKSQHDLHDLDEINDSIELKVGMLSSLQYKRCSKVIAEDYFYKNKDIVYEFLNKKYKIDFEIEEPTSGIEAKHLTQYKGKLLTENESLEVIAMMKDTVSLRNDLEVIKSNAFGSMEGICHSLVFICLVFLGIYGVWLLLT